MSINHRRLSISIAAGLILEAINKVSPLLILHHAQKTLGLTDFGIAQYQLTMLESVQPFIVFGVTNYALAQPGVQSDNVAETSAIFTHIGALKLINAILVSIFIFVAATYGQTSFTSSIYSTGILAIILLACVADAMWYSIARHKLAQMSLLAGLFRVTTLALIISMVSSPADTNLFILLCLAPNVAISIYSGIFAYRSLRVTRVTRAELKKTLIKSAPFALILVLITFLDRIDIFLVQRWFGTDGAGIYAGPAKVVQSLTLLIAALAAPFYAETLKLTDKALLYKHISFSLWFFTALASPIIFGAPFVETTVLHILFPGLPAAAENLLPISAIGILGTVLSTVFCLQILLPRGRSLRVMSAAALGIIIAVASTSLLMPGLSLRAAAIGIVLGKITLGIGCAFASREFLPRIPYASFFKPIIAGVIMGATLTIVSTDSTAINLLCGAVVYTTCLIAINYKEFKKLLEHPKFKYLVNWATSRS